MFIKRFTNVIYAALLFALLSACAANPAKQNATPLVDKSALNDNISKAFAKTLSTQAIRSLPTRPANTISIHAATTPTPVEKPSAEQRYAREASQEKHGPVNVVVSLQDQLAYVYRNGKRIGWSKISTGKGGYETPTGVFNILQKKKKHVSNLYPDGDMPYMQRLTWSGLALHGGYVPDYPASHGCIRFPHMFARQLYKKTRMGGQVAVLETFSGPEYIN